MRETLTPEQTLSAARYKVCKTYPYFRTAILSLLPIPCRGLGTFGVSKEGHLYWDPDIAVENGVDDLAVTMLHEVMHVLRRHASRAEALGITEETAFAFNVAADLEINDDILDDQGEESPGLWHPSMLNLPTGRTAEEYYRDLPRDENGKPFVPGVDNDGGTCGSGATGVYAPWETERGKDGRSQAEMERIRRETAESIRSHVERHGSVPGDWAVWADQELGPPQIPWQEQLARITHGVLAVAAGCTDYVYGRVARRQYGIGFSPGTAILPKMVARIPHVVMIIDVSSSMGLEELKLGVSEMKGVLDAVQCRVSLIVIDADIQRSVDIDDISQVISNLHGGGGTDFRPAFNEIRSWPKQPDYVAVFTDGGGPAPTNVGGLNVLWALVGRYAVVPLGEDGAPVDYGEKVFVV